MKSFGRSVIFLAALAFLFSCGDSSKQKPKKPPGKPVVHAVNYPVFYFAKRIGGDFFDLKFDAPPDVDPAFWEPADETIAAMQSADLLLMNGATYAKWAEHASLPSNTQVDTSKSFSNRFVTVKGSVTHRHGDGTVHAHDGIAFTTWLDMGQAKLQATAIRDALIRLKPDQKKTFEANAEKLFADLDSLDQSLKEIGKTLVNRNLIASHPVYQYLARRYQLKIQSLHWEPDVVPDDAAVAELDKLLENHPADVMIWEGDPVERSIDLLNEKEIRSIVFDPCGNRPESGDWLTVMKKNLTNLQSL